MRSTLSDEPRPRAIRPLPFWAWSKFPAFLVVHLPDHLVARFSPDNAKAHFFSRSASRIWSFWQSGRWLLLLQHRQNNACVPVSSPGHWFRAAGVAAAGRKASQYPNLRVGIESFSLIGRGLLRRFL